MYEHYKKMTIDLGQSVVTLYLDGILPTNAGVRVTLTSNYSQEVLWSQRTAADTIYDEWYELEVQNDNYANKSVAGYYTLSVEYLGDEWTQAGSFLIKAINSNNNQDTPVSYISDNDENEQVVYYKGN
jgi:Na+-transporting NADH:ubiquinone oxidoreductase subunit NqrF